MTWLEEYFGKELTTKEGVKPTAEVLAGKKVIAIYFSAHWCPPCRMFTPALGEFYTKFNAEYNNQLEVIFASSDEDESEFEEYYGEQPWVTLGFGSAEKDNLARKYGIRGIPSLIVLNGNGETIDAQGRSTVTSAQNQLSTAATKWGL